MILAAIKYGGGSEKWFCSWHALKVKPIGFVDWLHVGNERKREVKDNIMIFGQNIWKNEVALTEMVKIQIGTLRL